MKRSEVLRTKSAERELAEICGYVAETDSLAMVEPLSRRLLATTKGLASSPETAGLGIREYRQTINGERDGRWVGASG